MLKTFFYFLHRTFMLNELADEQLIEESIAQWKHRV